MDERKIKLRDLRRTIEDFNDWKTRLESCERTSWDGHISGFNKFLSENPVVGDQILALKKLTKDDVEDALLGTGPLANYTPPSDDAKRLSYIARLMFEKSSVALANIGYRLSRNSNVNAGFAHTRNEIISELLDETAKKLERRLEDLEEEYHNDAAALIPVSQTVIFQNVFHESTVAISTGSGDITFNIGAASELGVQAILRQLEQLKTVVQKISDEHERKDVANEADDLTLNRKLDEIIALVREGKPGPAVGKWKEFVDSLNVSTVTDAAGKIVDGVTLGMWLFNMSQGKPLGTGQG